MATRIGLEPTTPSVTGWCSNQLSYRAILEQRLLLHYGAADEARTRYLHLGKVALYQMSYGRILETLLGLLTGASDRNRTNDTGIFSPLLYRLSYRGIGAISACAEMAATRIGLEPTTPSVTGWCSNQLSYRATWWKLTGSNR